MAFISLTVKSRRGVPVNQIQLIDLNDLCSPITLIGNDCSFILSEYKRGPFANFNDTASIVEYVVDETLSQISTLAVGYLFTADVISIDGRVPKSPLVLGFNPEFVSGKIQEYGSFGASRFFYQEDGNPKLVEYIVDKSLAEILTQITPPTTVTPPTNYIFTDGVTESGGIVRNDYYTGSPYGNVTQNIYGSQQSGGIFIINSTTNATKGIIQLGGGINRATYREDNGRLGLNVSTPSGIIGIDGQTSDQLIVMETLNSTGANAFNLKIKASNANSGSSNRSGGALILSAGDSTGAAGFGDIQFQVSNNGAATTKMVLKGDGKVGINVTTPAANLHVIGSFLLNNGTQGAGKVLTSDASGVATWQTPATGSINNWLLGGNTNASEQTLGTTNSFDLPFIVGNYEVMRLHKNVRVLIGTPTELNTASRLQIFGNLTILDGTQGAGKVLTSDANGITSWQTPSSGGMSNPMTTTGDMIQSNPGSTPTRLAAVAAGNVLLSGGVATISSWGKVGLTTHVSGVLPQTNGGTGFSTYAVGDILVGISGSLVKLAIGTTGQVLTVSGGTATWQTPAASFTNPMLDIGDLIQGSTGGLPIRLPAVASGNVLLSNGTSTLLSWGKVGLTSHVTGVLAQFNGGTGFSTYATGDILVGVSGNLVKLPIGSNGQVLTVSGGTATWQNASTGFVNPMTTTGDMIQAAAGGTAVRLPAVAAGNALISGGVATSVSWGKIGLTTHVTGVLPVSNGGTGLSTYANGDTLYFSSGVFNKLAIGTAGQVLTVVGTVPQWVTPVSSSGWALSGNTVTSERWIGTIDNFDFPIRTNNTEKARFTASGRLGIGTTAPIAFIDIKSTSSLKGLSIDVGAGAVGALITTNNTTALDIVTGGGGINISNSHGSLPGIMVTNTGVASSGIMVDVLSGIGISVNSKFYTAGLFSQTGTLTSTNTSDLLALYRNFSLNGNDATGSVLMMSDDTTSTGNFLTIIKQNSTKLVIKSTGVLQYIDGNQAAGKVLTSDASGNATWQTPSGGGGGSYTFSTGLTLASTTVTANLSTGIAGGQSVIGGTAASNNLTLSSTTDATKGKIIFGSGNISAYTENNNRLGLGTNLPGARLDVWQSNGGNCLRVVNSDATTAAGGTIIGWQWTPITNGSNTNLAMYEQDASSGFTARVVYHAGGNVTIGPGTGLGDARLHVVGSVKIVDGNQAAGRVLTSDVLGNASWQVPAFMNPMTTIADIIQANVGGSPIKLSGSATAGTFLRSQGTGVLNHWSTLVLPNAATANQIMYATATNTMGMSSELTYISNSANGILVVNKSFNGSSGLNLINSDSGSIAYTRVLLSNGTNSLQINHYGTGNSGTGNGQRPNLSKIEATDHLTFQSDSGVSSSGGTKYMSWYIGSNNDNNERMRLNTGGLGVASTGITIAANDVSALIDLTSTTQGLRFPRMTTTQRTAISTTSKPGIVVFDTDTNQLMVTNNAGTWVAL